MKSAFDKIAAGLEDAIGWAEGDSDRARVVHPVDVKAIRQAEGMSQAEFSTAFRLPIGTIRDWEQHRREPDTGSRVYLSMIGADAEGVRRIIAKTR